MTFTVEFDREEDGRWIADVPALPGVTAYGTTQSDAFEHVRVLAFRVLADKIENGEYKLPNEPLAFVVAAA